MVNFVVSLEWIVGFVGEVVRWRWYVCIVFFGRVQFVEVLGVEVGSLIVFNIGVFVEVGGEGCVCMFIGVV